MIEEICKNCDNWERHATTNIGSGVVIAGTCNRIITGELFSDDVGIACGHDGPIYFDSNFGCIHFTPKGRSLKEELKQLIAECVVRRTETKYRITDSRFLSKLVNLVRQHED